MLKIFNLKTQLIKLNFHEVNSFFGFLGGMSWKLAKGSFFRVLCLVNVPRVSVHYEENPLGPILS
jgi:hypothetical protein